MLPMGATTSLSPISHSLELDPFSDSMDNSSKFQRECIRIDIYFHNISTPAIGKSDLFFSESVLIFYELRYYIKIKLARNYSLRP